MKYSKSRSTIAKKASISAIHAKKTAGLERVRGLLRTLPPEVSANLDQKELNTGVTARPNRSELGFPKGLRRSEFNVLICGRAERCADRTLVS